MSDVAQTTYERALGLLRAGQSAAEVEKQLIAEGLDAESAKVMVNALPGVGEPSVLPEANVALSTNALAPDLLSMSELGLSGDDATVGAYWLTFGLVLLVAMAVVLFVPVPELFGSEGPTEAFVDAIEVALPPVGFGIVGLACARGVYLLAKARVRLARRRK